MRRHLALIAFCALATGLTGCGGGSGTTTVSGGTSAVSSRSAGATFTILWPAKSKATRDIPTSTTSIEIEIYQGTNLIASQSVTAPSTGSTTTVTFSDLPLGALTAKLLAYGTYGSSYGDPIAEDTVNFSVQANKTNSVSAALVSTATKLAVSPTSLTLGAQTSGTITPTVTDAAGNTLYEGGSDITYSSSNATVASVDTSGNVNGLFAGKANITVKEVNAGLTVTVPVTVHLSLTPNTTSASLTLGQSETFSAQITGSANQAVTWSVSPATGGGTITPQGVYTAPLTGGTYTVTVTSQADTTQSAQITVTVTSGGGSISVQ
jgi:uncharacterized protein YjdB